MRILKFLLLFGMTVSLKFMVAQPNRISIQTGLFHSFFDGTSLINTNYKHKDRGIFSGLLYNSVGIQYQRMINTKSSMSFESAYFYEYYWNITPNAINKTVARRTYMTYNMTYNRNLPISETLNFTYGGGVNFRNGYDWIVVEYYPSSLFVEPKLTGRTYRDVGLNARTGIEYSPKKWLTLYTKFDLVGFVYTHNKEQIRIIRETYKVSNYPNYFDLSWQFGIGFNF